MAFIRNSDKLVEGLSNKFFTNLRAKQAVQVDLDSLSLAIQSEESSRQSEDSLIKGRLDVIEGIGIGSVKKAEQDAKSYADSLDTAMSLRVAALEADPVTKTYVDGQVSNLQGQITLEISNRESAVSSEQSRAQTAEGLLSGRLDVIEGMGVGSIKKAEQDAKDYADQKVAALVNSAPAVLDTLKELSDAIGGDQSFAATVAGQIGDVDDKVDQEILDRQSAISSEQTARQNADSALSGRLDLLEADPTTKTYVDGQVSSLNTRLLSLESDPTTKSYVDGKVTMLQGNIDQEALDRQSAISSEATSRENADNALDARLDVIEGSGAGSVAKALVDAKAYADGIVSSEQSARESADNLLDGRLDVLEADPTTKSYVDGQVGSLQSEDSTFFKLDGSRAMTGGLRVKHAEKSADYELSGNDYIIGVTSVTGGKTMTLPSASTMGAGKMFVIKDQSGGASVSNYIRIACQSGQQIDGQSSYDIDAPYESVTVVSNGTHWFIM